MITRRFPHLVYMEFGMGLDRAVNMDEEKWRLDQWFPNLAVSRIICRAVEMQIPGPRFQRFYYWRVWGEA